MQGHSVGSLYTPTESGTNQMHQKGAVLTRWVASDRRFVAGEFNWSDPLDVALGIQLASFRPGIDEYDA